MGLEDKAQEHEAKMWEQANAPRPERPVYESGDAGYGPEFCAVCDDPMPELRRRDGRQLCTSCQSVRERAASRRRI